MYVYNAICIYRWSRIQLGNNVFTKLYKKRKNVLFVLIMQQNKNKLYETVANCIFYLKH